MHDTHAILTLATDAKPMVLVSFIKPILMLIVLGVYLRVISSNLESDLRRALFNVPVRMCVQ